MKINRSLLLMLATVILLFGSCAAPASTSTTQSSLTSVVAKLPTYQLNVSVSPSGAGAVSPSGGNYESGSNVTLTATPTSGYTFDYWDGAISSSDNSVIIIMNSNKGITAHFKSVEAKPKTTTTPPASFPATTGEGLSKSIVVAATDATTNEKAMARLSGGAVCDGMADDVEIQAAIDTCSGTRWGTVKLIGSFIIATPIVMESYVHLDCTDAKISLVNGGNVNLLTAYSKNNFKITGGKWDGNRNNQTAACQGFSLTDCTDWTVRDAEILNIFKDADTEGGNALILLSSARGNILNNYIHDCGDPTVSANGVGIDICGTSFDDFVDGNTIVSCDGGIYLYCGNGGDIANNIIVSNNHISTITRDGISLYNNGNVGTITNNVIRNNHLLDCGMDTNHCAIVVGNLGDAEHNSVVGNIIDFTGNYGYGIIIAGNYNSITGNSINNSPRHAIVVEGANNNVIANNDIESTNIYWECIRLKDASLNNLIEANVMKQGEVGLMTEGNSSNNYFKNNVISTMSAYAMDVSATGDTGNIFEGNSIINTGTAVLDNGTGTMWRNNPSYLASGDVGSIERN